MIHKIETLNGACYSLLFPRNFEQRRREYNSFVSPRTKSAKSWGLLRKFRDSMDVMRGEVKCESERERISVGASISHYFGPW